MNYQELKQAGICIRCKNHQQDEIEHLVKTVLTKSMHIREDATEQLITERHIEKTTQIKYVTGLIKEILA